MWCDRKFADWVSEGIGRVGLGCAAGEGGITPSGEVNVLIVDLAFARRVPFVVRTRGNGGGGEFERPVFSDADQDRASAVGGEKIRERYLGFCHGIGRDSGEIRRDQVV